MNFILIQSIGLLGLAAFVYSFQLKERKQILQLQTVSSIIWIVHFLLLGAWTGVALFIINTLRTYTLFRVQKPKNWVLYAFIIAFIALGIITWQGWFSFFGILGIIFGTLSNWQKDSQKLRLVAIPASIFWIIYDLFVLSYSGALTEFIVVFSAIIGYIRGKRNTFAIENDSTA